MDRNDVDYEQYYLHCGDVCTIVEICTPEHDGRLVYWVNLRCIRNLNIKYIGVTPLNLTEFNGDRETIELLYG